MSDVKTEDLGEGVLAPDDPEGATSSGATPDGATSGKTSEGGQSADADAPAGGKGAANPPDEYEVDGLVFTADDVKMWHSKYEDRKNWETTLHGRGEEINKKEKEIKGLQKDLENDRGLIEEYRKVKASMTPEAYKEIQRLIKEGDKVTPALKAIEDKYDSKFRQLDYKEAALDLMKDHEDFDVKQVEGLLSGIDWENPTPKQLLEFGYYALKGKAFPEELQKARARDSEANRKKRGLPPTTGSGKRADKHEFGTVDEALEAALAEIGTQ